MEKNSSNSPKSNTLLEGKNVEKKGLEGSVVRLSQNCAEITWGAPVEMMTNIKMNLLGVDERLLARDFYGKVIKRSEQNGPNYIVRFTAVPPEVDSCFPCISVTCCETDGNLICRNSVR